MACCALDALSRSVTGQRVADSAAAGLPRNSWYPVPVVSRTEVTGLKVQGILALLHRFALDSITRPSLLFVTVIGTEKHQFAVASGGEVWLPANRRGVNYLVQYEKSPAPFYGIGPRTAPTEIGRASCRG